jgi:2-(1,2-epoxy-1,2-dihydrophenyl)acetyl-CoA isomerase
VPDLGSAWLLPRAVGIHAAKELMLLGEEISAEEAHRLGLVNRSRTPRRTRSPRRSRWRSASRP